MRTSFCSILALAMGLMLATGRAASAQEQTNPEQLKKAYDDALGQLKAAQERKNQLAAENEKLAGQIADMQKQLDQSKAEMDPLKRTDADHAKSTYFLRSHYAAWQEFVRHQPELQVRWKSFFENGFLLSPREVVEGLRLELGREEN